MHVRIGVSLLYELVHGWCQYRNVVVFNFQVVLLRKVATFAKVKPRLYLHSFRKTNHFLKACLKVILVITLNN